MKIIEQMKARGIVPKAVLYARFSSDNQRDESIDAQIRAMTKFCRENEVIVMEHYFDRARSATTDDRPEFLRMINDSKQRQFNIVLVHKLDRFARNRYDSSRYRNQLKKNGVLLVSVLENFDDSPESIIMESLLEGMAEYYSKNLSREVTKGHHENALQCKHNGGRPPFGFRVNPETQLYEIDEDEANAVRFIFQSFDEGKSYDYIINELNRLGYKTRDGNPFGKNLIHEMLKNEKYRGVYIYNRRAAKGPDGKFNSHQNKFDDEIVRIQDGMPRIVSDELFESVNRILCSRKRLKNYSGKKHTYLLTGKIFCGNCGSAYSGGTRRSGKKNKTEYSSYTCSTKHRYSGIKCKNKEIRREYIEDYVLREILRVVLSDEKIPTLVKKYQDYYAMKLGGSDGELNTLRSRIKEAECKIKNLVSVIASTGSTALLSALTEQESEKARLESELAIAESNLRASVLTEEEITAAYKNARELFLEGSVEAKRQLISLYLDKVLVFDDYVEVYLNALPLYIREKLIKKYRNPSKNTQIAEIFGRGDRI